jgi:imidazolonepropionase-like amidohydrolase
MNARKLLQILFLVVLALVRVSGASGPILVLANANVVDVRAGTVLPHMTVVIHNGRIEGVGKVGMIDTGHNVNVVNASGKYVIPGLWDMHVHTAGGPDAPWDEKVIYPLLVANGITGIRDMGGDPNLLEERRKKIDSGDLTGPTIFYGGPFLRHGKSDNQTVGVNTSDEARRAVDDLKKRGMDFIKILSDLPRDEYFAVAEQCSKRKIPLVGHVPDAVSAVEAAHVDQKSIEHLSGVLLMCSAQEDELRPRILEAIAKQDQKAYSAAQTALLDTYDAGKAKQLFAVFAREDTWQVPTLTWWQAQIADDDLADENWLRYVPGWARKDWNPEALRKAIGPATQVRMKFTVRRYFEIVREMKAAGVHLLAGTDSPDPLVFPGFGLHHELQLLVASGLTPAEALRTATLSPGVFLGRSADFGAVEKGKVADVVLLKENPLADIRNTQKIEAVVLRGKYFSRKDLDKMLAEVEAAAKAQ